MLYQMAGQEKFTSVYLSDIFRVCITSLWILSYELSYVRGSVSSYLLVFLLLHHCKYITVILLYSFIWSCRLVTCYKIDHVVYCAIVVRSTYTIYILYTYMYNIFARSCDGSLVLVDIIWLVYYFYIFTMITDELLIM